MPQPPSQKHFSEPIISSYQSCLHRQIYALSASEIILIFEGSGPHWHECHKTIFSFYVVLCISWSPPLFSKKLMSTYTQTHFITHRGEVTVASCFKKNPGKNNILACVDLVGRLQVLYEVLNCRSNYPWLVWKIKPPRKRENQSWEKMNIKWNVPINFKGNLMGRFKKKGIN